VSARGERTPDPYVLLAGEAELRWFGETSTFFLATGETTDGAFALVDERAAQGEAVPLHRHSADIDSFYVLEGELTFFIGDTPGRRATAGAFAHVPAGAVHGFRVESEHARYLILTTPRHGEFYRSISVPSAPDGARPAGEFDFSRLQEKAQEYGIELVGPLPAA
jgi:quercetin dioxygenase-like cupin family protein